MSDQRPFSNAAGTDYTRLPEHHHPRDGLDEPITEEEAREIGARKVTVEPLSDG